MLPASLSARWLPKDFVESSVTGGVLTLVGYVMMLVLFTCELWSFLSFSVSSELVLDHLDGPQLQINFNVDMHDIGCSNLEVVVTDEMSQTPIRSFSKHYELSTIDKNGRLVATHSTKVKLGTEEDEDEEALHLRTAERLKQQDGQQELDSDWATSHDGFKHQSFEHVVQFHDFTLINFFAEWCVHCRQFAPMWKQISDEVRSQQIADRDGKMREVAAIKINCVDFAHICRENRIQAFPMIRLYKSDGSFARFEGHRTLEGVVSWVKDTVHTQGYAMKKDHQELAHGCNVKGFLRVPRVPGNLELMAGAGDQNLDPTATNVSHSVKHLSFSDPQNSRWYMMVTMPSLPLDMMGHVAPLDGRQFCTQAFHEAYEHHLRVVSTVTGQGVGYQFSHYGRTARLNTSVVPQARFHYDLDPFTIRVQRDNKPWYDFGTSLLAILGGIFVILRLLTLASLAVSEAAARRSGPGRAGADGLLSSK